MTGVVRQQSKQLLPHFFNRDKRLIGTGMNRRIRICCATDTVWVRFVALAIPPAIDLECAEALPCRVFRCWGG